MASQGNDCYFYYYSNCSRGDSCAFRHCPEALGNEVVCSLWREGRCFRAICSYRHMEIDKQRSAIPCYWESQPSGCLKDHCPFLHSKRRESLTSSSADVKSAVPTHATGPQRGSIPTPVVEPIIVNPQDDPDDASSVEVSPVKKISFSSKTIKLGTKDVKPGGDEASIDFGIKTLSQLRENKTAIVISTTQGAVPSPVVKSVNHRNVVSVRNVEEKKAKSGEDESKKVLSMRPPMKRKLIVANEDDGDAKSSRKLVLTQGRQPPTRILLKSGGDSVDSSRPTTVLRLSGEGMISSQGKVESKVGEKGDTGIKTLEQIRKERRVKVSSPLSTESKTGVKTLDEIRRKRMVTKIATGVSQENVAVVKSLEEIRKARATKRTLEDTSKEDGDIGVKTLKQIRLEKDEESSAVVTTTSQSGNPGVKSLEQIRRERIARRLGLVEGQNGQQENKNRGQLIVKRTQKVDGAGDSLDGDQAVVGSVLRRLGPAVTGGDKRKLVTGGDSGDSDTRKESSVTNQLTKKKSELSPIRGDLKLSLPKRRVTLSTSLLEKAEMGKREEKKGMKDRLGRREASGGSEEEEGGDGAVSVNARLGLKKVRDNVEGEEDEDEKRKELKKDDRKPEMRKISLRRREDGVKSSVKRRADRQIYQPPGAKLKGTTSRIGSLSESQETEEEPKSKETNSGKTITLDKSPKKRPRITFQTDGISSLTSDTTDKNESRLKLKRRNVTERDTKVAEENPDQNSLSDRSKKTTNDLPELSAGKRRKGVGLRERLLQQSQKFAVGSTVVRSEETATIDSVFIAAIERNVTDTNGGSREPKQTKSLTDEKEDGVVSSSGVRSGITSPLQAVDKSPPQVTIDQIMEKPSSTTTTPCNVPLSNLDTTNTPVPKQPTPGRSSMSSLKPNQLQGKGENKDVVQRRDKKEPVEDPKRKMSMTEDEFAGLLDDVGADEDDFNDVDDDDALLEELEDLINA